jgi:CRISPR-associated protein Cas2
MTQRNLYLAAYDITEPRRLAAALKLVRAYASGGQKSAHEIHLTDAERRRLLDDMARLLDAGEDSFVLVRLDPRARVETLGRAIAPDDGACLYFG